MDSGIVSSRYSVDYLCPCTCIYWLQHVADLGSGLQSAQQRQLAVVRRLDSLALACSTLNSSVSSFDDMITSLNTRLSNIQAIVNETLVC